MLSLYFLHLATSNHIPFQPHKCAQGDEHVPPDDWLLSKVKEFESEGERELWIPTRENNQPYEISLLYKDQQAIVSVILETLDQWLNGDDLESFRPLRMTVNGSGGSGKSVIINTVVAVMRRMFGMNDVVKVAAPTGTAAFNVGGETFHHMLGNAVTLAQYRPNTMQQKKRLHLIQKFKTLLCLIIDERSLVNSSDLGTTERMIAETIYGGGNSSDKSFGGLPIVILFGDDYQLPGGEEGGLAALFSRGGGKMTQGGRRALLECAECVMELKGSKRMKENLIKQKELLNRLRIGDIMTREDVKKLLSLHIDAIEKRHGRDVTQAIRKKAMFLFFTNEKRIRHNLKCLAETCGPNNPVAILRTQSGGPVGGKAVASHFDSKSKVPDTSIICVDAKVALENRNFCPIWGLHNGACGIVREIVYAKGCSPHTGDFPLYVVVEFPQYCGPPWDTSNPTVRL